MKPTPTLSIGACLAAVLILASCATAPSTWSGTPVTLGTPFGDHAVLQRGKPVPVWGWASPGDQVTVAFQGHQAEATAGADGKWTAVLPALTASSTPEDLVVSGSNTVTLHDIVVGEVWLCSGQSNMEFGIRDSWSRVRNADEEVVAAHFPLIRQLRIDHVVSDTPAQRATNSGWKTANPMDVGNFTAVGYFFARDIHSALGVPVGIVMSPWGGTPVESWMSADCRHATTLGAVIDQRWKDDLAKWTPEKLAQYKADYAAWQKAQDQAMATHTKNPLAWPPPPATADSPYLPGGLYNAMIHPLEPFAIRGFLWYQGESNAGRPSEYAELFGAMITSWRASFGQGDLPFYFVQLANYGDPSKIENRSWAFLREAQQKTLALPNTGMAVTADIGEAEDIHPRNKQEVGRRLALIARAQVYGLAPEFIGPTLAGIQVEGSSIRVRFSHTGGELAVRGDSVASLEVAGEDKVFHPATAKVEVDTLVVGSPDVAHPVAVRYAWNNSPSANLYGLNGLPAVPFRSDSW